LNIYPGFH